MIIMDNAGYHKVRSDHQSLKKSISSMKKKELQEYLTANDVSWSERQLKKDLYKKAQEYRKTLDVEVERLAEESGHEVLWLPPYHSTLNPIELMWGVTKNYIASQFSRTSMSRQDLKERIFDGFQKCAKELWKAL